MASGDAAIPPKILTYSKSKIPFVGSVIDYVETSFQYLCYKTYTHAEKLHPRSYKASLSTTFLVCVCFVLGLTTNVKFEVVTFDEEPLPLDLHFMLMSSEDNLYIDDVDVSKVMWCLEASDVAVILISCVLILNSISTKSPLSEYLYLPWLGASLRGLLLRQAPTAGALLYTVAVVDGTINPLFLTAFSFFYLMEARLWLEIARLLIMRWQRREYVVTDTTPQLQTLWSNDDSLEVANYSY